MPIDTIRRVTLSFRDAKGFIGRTTFYVGADSTSGTYQADLITQANAVQNAIEALTNAALQSNSFDANPITLTYGGTGVYQAEFMKAVMQFSNDDGQIFRFKIPAPKAAIFDSDGVTVLNDGTQADVVAYVAAMKGATNTAVPCSKTGLPFTHFEGGLLRIGKQQRRFNERIKSSHLVAGEGE